MSSFSRKILVCTGPPLRRVDDKRLGRKVAEYDGDIVICGGTTSQVISRELGREMVVILKRDPAGLPPTSKMDGVLLITEGVLTLENVVHLLENATSSKIEGKGIDAKLANILLEHEKIDFIVGRAVNQTHQSPRLPKELEQRRDLVATLAEILKNKFSKKIELEYI